MSKRKTQLSRMLRNNATPAERRLWQYLRNRQLNGNRFRRQHPIGPYIVDFVCLEKRLIIELDGNQHGIEATKDVERDSWLSAQGFRVLRFWNHEVLKNAEGVVETIRAQLDAPSPTITMKSESTSSSQHYLR